MTIWQDLLDKAQSVQSREIGELFEKGNRAAGFSRETGPFLFDFSKTNIDAETLDLLVKLAEEKEVAARAEAMFTGEKINDTEGRAVLHTALRNLETDVFVDGENVMPEVRTTYARMEAFARDVREGKFTGQGGKITDVVNIGIGGSHLGPEMGTLALRPYHDGPRCHFVSNVDGADIADTLAGLDPAVYRHRLE